MPLALVVSLRVEIWSDVVCPWCYVGKRRSEAAVARFAHRDEVELIWRSFELDVSAPPSSAEPGTYAARLATKYRCSVVEAQALAYGISGVPFFVIDGRYGISGAQPPDTLLDALESAWSERSPLTLVAPGGSASSCEGDGTDPERGGAAT